MINVELERHDWIRPRWSSDKFTASSPFRSGDSSASFYVWLKDNPRFNARAGDWGDSGAVDAEWRRGDFTKLLAFLRKETYEEAAEYLRYTYATEWTSEDEISLSPPRLALDTARKPLDIHLLDQYAFRHPYLERRGVSEAVQRAYRVGYDRERQAVTIPWFLPNGNLANIMYRSVNSKVFWFALGAWPIRSLLFGIDVIYRRKVKRAALVEAPIDALYNASCGIPTLATGGATFNEEKRDVIIRSGIEELTIFHDNDGGPGVEMRRVATEMLQTHVTVRHVEYPAGVKDPTEVGDRFTINEMYDKATKASKSFQLVF
ncbi:toprim domain-containing protein [Paenibacillus sp. ACRRX]|uniref:toprim domain-containing protein n=1 Tax=Paenibacillus sp. ACRRX TaxID=2918206 RepID=UPI001EF74908|nr:toprim domain-containing protein [Paenibacillus sp. ACRRX]MCG7407740.1 toprim domain-containing protein [Paenibacillus sp. ACRRX]